MRLDTYRTMDRLPVELKTQLIETAACTNILSCLSLSSTCRTFHDIYTNARIPCRVLSELPRALLTSDPKECEACEVTRRDHVRKQILELEDRFSSPIWKGQALFGIKELQRILQTHAQIRYIDAWRYLDVFQSISISSLITPADIYSTHAWGWDPWLWAEGCVNNVRALYDGFVAATFCEYKFSEPPPDLRATLPLGQRFEYSLALLWSNSYPWIMPTRIALIKVFDTLCRTLFSVGRFPVGVIGRKHLFEEELGPSAWRRDYRDLVKYLRDGDFDSAATLVSLWKYTGTTEERDDDFNWQHVVFIWPDRIFE